MHALKRLTKLKRLVDWRAGRYMMHVPVWNPVFPVSYIWGAFQLLHLLFGYGR